MSLSQKNQFSQLNYCTFFWQSLFVTTVLILHAIPFLMSIEQETENWKLNIRKSKQPPPRPETPLLLKIANSKKKSISKESLLHQAKFQWLECQTMLLNEKIKLETEIKSLNLLDEESQTALETHRTEFNDWFQIFQNKLDALNSRKSKDHYIAIKNEIEINMYVYAVNICAFVLHAVLF